MTEPSQYFKGRTVQEQMNEVIGYVDTRAAEVATTAIAADVAQVHQDMLDADADASAAAASAAAAAGTLANAVKKTGEASQSIAGDIAVAGNLTGGSVTVPAPVNNTDAASKKYVDDQDALDVHLAGNQTVADVKTFSSSPVVPTEATGTYSANAANSTKVRDEINNLSVTLAGAQTIAAQKTFQLAVGDYAIKIKGSMSDVTLGSFQGNVPHLAFFDKNDVQLADLRCFIQADGRTTVNLVVRNADGTTKTITLGDGNQ